MNNFAILEEKKIGDTEHIFIDTKHATFRNVPWTELGDWGKRKNENIVFLTKAHENNRQKRKFHYVW